MVSVSNDVMYLQGKKESFTVHWKQNKTKWNETERNQTDQHTDTANGLQKRRSDNIIISLLSIYNESALYIIHFVTKTHCSVYGIAYC